MYLIISTFAAFVLLTGGMVGIFLAGAGLLILKFTFNGNFSVIGNGIWNLFNNFSLTAMPVFIFLAEIAVKCGIARRIYTSLAPLFSRLPGRLLQTNIGMCTIFASMSGSSMATTAIIGSMAYEEMEKLGYRRSAILGSIAGGGTLGILIPPSLPLIIYGSWQEVSVGSLFIGGILPGLMIAGMFMIYIGITQRAYTIGRKEEERLPMRKVLVQSLGAWPFLILLFSLLGTIFLGLATATEAAALGVVAVLILAAFYRELTLRRVIEALFSTTVTYSTMVFIFVGAIILSQAAALSGIPEVLFRAVLNLSLQTAFIIALVYFLYVIMGCFFGAIEMLLITLPFTYPLMTGLGYHPVWLGIALVIIIEISFLTPPMGMNLYVLIGITKGRVSLGEVAKAAIPYWIILFLGLILITLFPELVMYLPSLMD